MSINKYYELKGHVELVFFIFYLSEFMSYFVPVFIYFVYILSWNQYTDVTTNVIPFCFDHLKSDFIFLIED